MYRIFSNFAKSCIFTCLSKFYKKKEFYRAFFFKYKHVKLKLRVFLAGHSVAIVTYSEMKMLPTCSPVLGYNDPPKSMSWKLLETVLTDLKLSVRERVTSWKTFDDHVT